MPCIEIKSTDYTSHPKDSTNLNAYKKYAFKFVLSFGSLVVSRFDCTCSTNL